MRKCPKCRKALRAHDGGFQVQVCSDQPQLIGMGFQLGGYVICHECYRLMNPNAPPLRVPHPETLDPVQSHFMAKFYCAVCETYAREDDGVIGNGRIRITAADALKERGTEPDHEIVELMKHHKAGRVPDRALGNAMAALGCIRPGVKNVCHECYIRWAPIIADRWREEKVIGPKVRWFELGYELV